jgi:hypothetical protein
MLSALECPYCASSENKLISSFYSGVLEAKTIVYQCEQCLNLFDFPGEVKRSELQKRLSDLQQDADKRTAVTEAANAIGILDNQELAVKIAQIQQENLIAQLDLIHQEIAVVNSANQELLEKLREQEFDIQVKLVEVQKKELQRRLSDLQAEDEKQISIAAAPDISIDTGNESQVLVVIYCRDSLGNSVPVDSSWATPSNIRSSNLEYETPTSLDTVDSSVSRLLKLLFAVFQIIFGIWLLCLGFGF